MDNVSFTLKLVLNRSTQHTDCIENKIAQRVLLASSAYNYGVVLVGG